jgi:DNA polymerase sigma
MVTLRQIQVYADEVVRLFAPEKIVLFGSHSKGQATPDSDVDLLVVMPFRGRAPYKAAMIRSAVPAPFAMDLLVRSSGQLQRRLKMGDSFLREVVERGRVLHEA